MELTEEDVMQMKPLSLHQTVEDEKGNNKYMVALDELPIALENPFTGKQEKYETMVFPINEKGEVDYGEELLTERYDTPQEAVNRFKTIWTSLEDGYEFNQILPQGLKLEVLDEDKTIEGLKLKEHDVVVRDGEDKAILIGKIPAESFKDRVRVDKDNPEKQPIVLDGYMKFQRENGKTLWKAQSIEGDEFWHPSQAMFDASKDVNQQREITRARRNVLMQRDEDFFVSPTTFAFTKELTDKEIVVDRYIPTRATGVFLHHEELYKNKQLWKITEKEPTSMKWNEFKQKAQDEIKQIKKAKDLRLLFLPGNTTVLSGSKLQQMEKEPSLHTQRGFQKKADEKTKPRGIRHKSNTKGQER